MMELIPSPAFAEYIFAPDVTYATMIIEAVLYYTPCDFPPRSLPLFTKAQCLGKVMCDWNGVRVVGTCQHLSSNEAYSWSFMKERSCFLSPKTYRCLCLWSMLYSRSQAQEKKNTLMKKESIRHEFTVSQAFVGPRLRRPLQQHPRPL